MTAAVRGMSVRVEHGDEEGFMPRLTEQEQQEIIRFMEADKPLPDKYRFLLFADKREVELVWNGKTGEVCNIVLPFQVIEQVDEPRAEGAPRPVGSGVAETAEQYGFDFDSRGRQLKGWTNKLIWGDIQLILSSLKRGTLSGTSDIINYRDPQNNRMELE